MGNELKVDLEGPTVELGQAGSNDSDEDAGGKEAEWQEAIQEQRSDVTAVAAMAAAAGHDDGHDDMREDEEGQLLAASTAPPQPPPPAPEAELMVRVQASVLGSPSNVEPREEGFAQEELAAAPSPPESLARGNVDAELVRLLVEFQLVPELAQLLEDELGVQRVEDLAELEPEDLTALPGLKTVPRKRLQRLVEVQRSSIEETASPPRQNVEVRDSDKAEQVAHPGAPQGAMSLLLSLF
eukprot:SAG11_NODE_3561_length_2371_cov_1.840229_2_plen_240_part_00